MWWLMTVAPKVGPAVMYPPSPDASTTGRRGKPCPVCGSTNVRRADVLRARPSILYVLLFGWIFLLIRGALSMRSEECRDCNAIHRYKSAGSWVALAVLVFLVLCVVLALYSDGP